MARKKPILNKPLESSDGDKGMEAGSGILIAGIGASAGGLKSFTKFLEAMPSDSGMAFVLVQHLDPAHTSILTELVSPHTAMAVVEIEDGIKIQPNTVYVMPPNTNVAILHDTPNIRVALTEVSEQRKAEAAVHVYQTKLEKLVDERTADLLQSNTELEHQRMLAEALIEIVADLNGSLDLDKVLDRILTNLRRIVPHDTASVLLVEDDQLVVARSVGNGMQHDTNSQQLHLRDVPHLNSPLSASRQKVVHSLAQGEYWLKSPVSEKVRSYICTPILKDGDLLGLLTVESFTSNSFDDHQAKLVQAVVHHAALAIWNVYACMNQQEAAVDRERQRIAMELHDAVSQSLWSANMIAESLPDLWQKNPVGALEKTHILKDITHGTLAEMRALMLEIRPDELESIPLVQSIEWLIKAVQARIDIQLEYIAEGEEHLSPAARRAIYRITQEALNNAVRHAQAAHIVVRLICTPDKVWLTVSDNGVGFRVDILPIAGHYGILNMQKRAGAVGATLIIISEPEQGTTIELHYPQ